MEGAGGGQVRASRKAGQRYLMQHSMGGQSLATMQRGVTAITTSSIVSPMLTRNRCAGDVRKNGGGLMTVLAVTRTPELLVIHATLSGPAGRQRRSEGVVSGNPS
ncbi:hypothetical protein MSZK_40820 [Mycobacterium sp. shizuoka-1]|nr:hypothetical protein MSZK_40820 [Mycobacterium sp. shizuoka-1]